MLDKETYTKSEVIDMLYELAYVVDEHRRDNYRKVQLIKNKVGKGVEIVRTRLEARITEEGIIFDEMLSLIDTIDYEG